MQTPPAPDGPQFVLLQTSFRADKSHLSPFCVALVLAHWKVSHQNPSNNVQDEKLLTWIRGLGTWNKLFPEPRKQKTGPGRPAVLKPHEKQDEETALLLSRHLSTIANRLILKGGSNVGGNNELEDQVQGLKSRVFQACDAFAKGEKTIVDSAKLVEEDLKAYFEPLKRGQEKLVETIHRVVKTWSVEEQVAEVDAGQEEANEELDENRDENELEIDDGQGAVDPPAPLPASNKGTPFHNACRAGNTELAIALLHESPKIATIRDPVYKRNGFLWACFEGQLEIVELLLQDNRTPMVVFGDTDVDGRSALLLASQNGHLAILSLLAEAYQTSGQITSVDTLARSALHLACRSNHLEVVRFLLSSKDVEPDLADIKGRSPLHEAIATGNLALVSLFFSDQTIRAKIDWNRNTSLGESPFFIACDHGHLEIIRFFLDKKIELKMNVKAANYQLLSPVDVAREEVARILPPVWEEVVVKREPIDENENEVVGKRGRGEEKDGEGRGRGKKVKSEPRE